MSQTDSICLECGICCDGTLFSGVMLKAKDQPERLRSEGLGIRVLPSGTRLSQPCRALTGCRCEIYERRPEYCRRFECLVLKEVQTGVLSHREALIVIHQTKRLARKAARILTLLDSQGDKSSLRKRFERVSKRLNQSAASTEEAAAFYTLGLTMHRLNLVLSKKFYPSPHPA